MRIQVLYHEGCPNYRRAIDLVRSVAPNATIEEVEIKSQADAVRMRFLGSPTILVDGADMEGDARGRTDFGFTCRTYGGSGVPSRELVASAIASRSRSTQWPAGNWFAGSSVALASVASACCWLPLVIFALGTSTIGLSSSFEAFRPWLLGGSAMLLAGGFFSAYRNQACCTRQARGPSRAMVWMAAALVLAFALFPLCADAVMDPIEGSACCTSPKTHTLLTRQTALTEQPASVTVLSDDAHELKDAFNADKEVAKVILIVSPRCPACRAGASVVQEQALAQTSSEKLKIYVVWINRLPGDSLMAAREATELVSDKRASHFWDGRGAVGKQYGKVIQLPKGKKFAWDVYLVFGPKAEWSDTPPMPDFWMHQLGGPETGNLLDGRKFREGIVKQLP